MSDDTDALQPFLEDNDRKFCPRCKCCEMFWQSCDNCGGEGTVWDEDDCDDDAWVDACGFCEGKCGWWTCDCDEKGIHHCGRCTLAGHTSLTCKVGREETR